MALDPVTSVLVQKLEPELRKHVLARREMMLREFRFLRLREDRFLNIVQSAGWTDQRLEVLCGVIPSKQGAHLAPTLFVGGFARALHNRMIAALETTYPMNVVVGLHSGTWSLLGRGRTLNRLEVIPSNALMQLNEQGSDDLAIFVRTTEPH